MTLIPKAKPLSEPYWSHSGKSSVSDLLKITIFFTRGASFLARTKKICSCKTLTSLGYKTVEKYKDLISNSLIFPCRKHISDITINLSTLLRKIEDVGVPVLRSRWTFRCIQSVYSDTSANEDNSFRNHIR